MRDAAGSILRHAATAACLLLLARPAGAQPPEPNPPETAEFLSRYDFHLSIAGLAEDDDRFSWVTHFGGEFDFVDYVRGRAIVALDYQAFLGKELRPFDPNQGNYGLSVAGSWRFGRTEVLGVFYHMSRHLSDRPKYVHIAWNDAQVRAVRQFNVRSATVDVRAQAGKIVARGSVDYEWSGELDALARRQLSPRVGLFGRAYGQLIGVDPDIYGRDTQHGGRLEAGVRFRGNAGSLEVFGGYEQMIDADPFDLQPRHWAFAGIRLVSN